MDVGPNRDIVGKLRKKFTQKHVHEKKKIKIVITMFRGFEN